MEKKIAECERNVKDHLGRKLGETTKTLKQEPSERQVMEEEMCKQVEELLQLQAKLREQENMVLISKASLRHTRIKSVSSQRQFPEKMIPTIHPSLAPSIVSTTQLRSSRKISPTPRNAKTDLNRISRNPKARKNELADKMKKQHDGI